MQIRRKRKTGGDHVGPRITIWAALDDLLDAKRAQRLARRTLEDYSNSIVSLGNWLEDNDKSCYIADIKEKDLLQFVAWMTYDKSRYEGHPTKQNLGQKGLAPATINNRLRYIKSLFSWCVKEGYISVSPAEEVRFQKVDTDKIKYYTKKQIRKLLAATERQSFAGVRDYTIMLTLLDNGLRISELLSVDRRDIDFQEEKITVRGENAKTGQTREVPMSPETAKLLADLIKENHAQFGPVEHVFCNSLGGRLRPDSFDDRLKLYRELSGLTDIQVSAHCFRHTMAVMYVKRGGDPFSLQKILGHSDLTMVKHYVRLANVDIQDKHRRYSPLRELFD